MARKLFSLGLAIALLKKTETDHSCTNRRAAWDGYEIHSSIAEVR